jgi:hypothetical protein
VEGCRIHGGLSHPLLDIFSMSVIVPAKAGLFGKVFCNLRLYWRKGRLRSVKSHQDIDRRSLLLHRLVSGKLLRNPALVERPRATISRWRSLNPDAPALREWEDLLSHMEVPVLAKFLRSRSEDAIRMRQSSPFVGILTEKERGSVMRKYAASRA